MYPNLFFVEGWINDLTKEVEGLIYERSYSRQEDTFGGHYTYEETSLFKNQFFLSNYKEKASSVLRKLDTYRDDTLLNDLKNELRDGQFDNQKTYSLNKYIGKVTSSFSDLWMIGFDFDDFYSSHLPKYVSDCETHNDGIKYYYENEELELGNILYRIRSFFKYSGLGYKANPDEYTVESVMHGYANFDSVNSEIHDNKIESIGPDVKLKWNCNPAIAGYIISELVRAGYIEPPKTNGELSYAKLARICNQIFDIQADGKPTTPDYLKKVVNPESNQLPDYKRAKLKLPDLDQLT